MIGSPAEWGCYRTEQRRLKSGKAEVGEMFAGDKTLELGATVIFDSVGMVAEDVAAAKLVWDLQQQLR